MTTSGLSVTATMLVGIDRFVARAEDGVGVPCSENRVQPWLCGEALLGGALWALWMDGVIDIVVRDVPQPAASPQRPVGEIHLRRQLAYPASSLECRLVDALPDRPEPAVDTLTRCISFTRAQPWLDVADIVLDELAAAGYLSAMPLNHNGTSAPTPAPSVLVPDCARLAELTPALLAMGDRWDRWWRHRHGHLVAVGRACHDALAARRVHFARQITHGLPLPSEQPYDPAEAAAAHCRSRCPRWIRQF